MSLSLFFTTTRLSVSILSIVSLLCAKEASPLTGMATLLITLVWEGRAAKSKLVLLFIGVCAAMHGEPNVQL